MSTFSALITKYGTIDLDDNMQWRSETPMLTKLANMSVPIDYSEADGDPRRFLLVKLKEKLGGRIIIRQEWRSERTNESKKPKQGKPAGKR